MLYTGYNIGLGVLCLKSSAKDISGREGGFGDFLELNLIRQFILYDL